MFRPTPYLAALLVLLAAGSRLHGVTVPSSAPAPTRPAAAHQALSLDGMDDADDLGGIAPSTKPATRPSHGGKDLGLGDDSNDLLLFQDIPVVVAAGKREQTEKQVAASVSVVTAADIEDFGYRSIADVLRDQRSFYLHTDGLNEFLGVRGFLRPGEWNARVLVLVDGRPTNETIYGQTHIDQDFVVPIEAVKRVEIIRGPGSSLYGTNAVFAVINVVTREGAEINGVETKIEGGNKDTGRINVLYGHQFKNGLDLVGDFAGYSSQGDTHIHYDGVNDAAHNFGNINNFDYAGDYAGFVKGRFGDFTFEYDAERRNKDNRSATYDVSFFNPGSMHEARNNATLKFDHDLGDGQSVHGMVYYGEYKYDQNYVVAATDSPPTPAFRYVTQGSDGWLGEEVHYDWQATDKLHVLAGASGTQSTYAIQDDHDDLSGRDLHVPSSYNTFGLFTEVEVKTTKWLTLVAGARYDQTQRTGTSVSPRAAAIVTPDNQDTLKLLYGRAFRDPNLYELLYSSPGTNVPNPKLKREVVDTYEAVWERQYKNGWSTTLDGYLWRMGDAMDNVDVGDGLQTQNVGTIWAHGVEAEADKRWANGGSLRIFGTYGRDEEHGSLLQQSPDWICGLALAMPIYKNNTFLSIEPQIVGPQKSDLGHSVHTTYLTNVVFTSKDIIKGWTLQAGAYGLFANNARMPYDGSGSQFETTLKYPTTQYLVSLSYRY